MCLQRTAGCDGLVMFLGYLWTGYPNLPWDVLQLRRGKGVAKNHPEENSDERAGGGGTYLGRSAGQTARRRPKLKTGLSGDVWFRPYVPPGMERLSEWAVADPGGGEGARPPYFQNNLRPEGPKNVFFFQTGSSPLSQGQDERPPSLSEGLDLPLVNESVSHSPMVTA